MAKNFIQQGDNIDVVAPADVLSGEGVLVGANLFGIAVGDALSGKPLAIGVEGVYDVAKLTTDVVAAGAKLNWNDTNTELQLATSDLDGVATAIEAAGNGVLKVQVKLTPV